MQENSWTAWDRFATGHWDGCLYHLRAWGDAVKRSYSHNPDYFMALHTPAGTTVRALLGNEASDDHRDDGIRTVAGILPIVHIRHRLFGNSLVSMPYCDAGGLLAANEIGEQKLLEHVLNVADERDVSVVELRQYHPLCCVANPDFVLETGTSVERKVRSMPGWRVSIGSEGSKVRMTLGLHESADGLMRSFNAKLRSQIRKSAKNGLVVKIGGVELVDDFYQVFSINMRDLGSPVHSREFICQVLLNFPGKAQIFIVYGLGIPMACSLALGFKKVLSNPWASALRRYSHLAPNMLLYWSMLEFACENGYQAFDFGRSTVGEGTYRFKEQWGAKPSSLNWYRFSRGDRAAAGTGLNKSPMARAMEIWKWLPVPVTRYLGPKIRRYITL